MTKNIKRYEALEATQAYTLRVMKIRSVVRSDTSTILMVALYQWIYILGYRIRRKLLTCTRQSAKIPLVGRLLRQIEHRSTQHWVLKWSPYKYVVFNLFPTRSSDLETSWPYELLGLNLSKDAEQPLTGAILLQGGLLLDHKFTVETVRMYRELNPRWSIIVSTWNSEDKVALRELEKICDRVVTSDIPATKGPTNINLQILSTRAALIAAGEMGVELVAKTRTDQRYYRRGLFDLLSQQLPLTSPAVPRARRLIVSSPDSFIGRLPVLSDFFFFGSLHDVKFFWSACDFVQFNDRYPEEFGESYAEHFLWTNYWRKLLGDGLTESQITSQLWERILMLPRDTSQFYWPKYTNRLCTPMRPPSWTEVTQMDLDALAEKKDD